MYPPVTRSSRQHPLLVPPPVPPILVCFLPNTNRLVTTFWLRNDRVTRRLKTSKPQGLTRHLVHTPTRHCLLFVLHTSTPHSSSYLAFFLLHRTALIYPFSPPRLSFLRRIGGGGGGGHQTLPFLPQQKGTTLPSKSNRSFSVLLALSFEIFRNFSKSVAGIYPPSFYPSSSFCFIPAYKYPSSSARMHVCWGDACFVTAVSESNKTVDATWSRRKTRQTNFEIPISPSWIYVSDINRRQ